MSEIEVLLQQEKWRFWDQSLSGKSRSALESFASDDLLCHLVGQQQSPGTVRTWGPLSNCCFRYTRSQTPVCGGWAELSSYPGIFPYCEKFGRTSSCFR